MIKKILILTVSCIFIFLFIFNVYAIKILPLVDASLGIGNSFFQDTASGFGGDVYVDCIPVMKITEDIDVLPRLSLRYQGNRRLAELAGGGTLFQQAVDGNVSVKYMQHLDRDLIFKINAGFDKEWLRETADEIWGLGLYDYNKSGVGIEVDRGSIRGGYNFYILRFPNYCTLASMSDTIVGKELAGEYVLDYNVNEIYVAGKRVWSEGAMYKYGYTYSRIDYTEQKIVNESAEYLSEKRFDNMHNVTGGCIWSLPDIAWEDVSSKPSFSFSAAFTWNQSNQNHYDPEKIEFIPLYYDYFQFKISPSYNMHFLPVEIDAVLMYEYVYRGYLGRFPQDSGGDYLKVDKMNTETHSIAFYLNYPFSDYFSIFFSTAFNSSVSNNKYEAVYLYNYSSGSYLTGISFKY